MPKQFTVDPAGISSVVTISGGDLYDNSDGTGSPVTFPQTITAVTNWFSMETAETATRDITVEVGGVTVLDYTVSLPAYINVPQNIDPTEQAQSAGGSSGADVSQRSYHPSANTAAVANGVFTQLAWAARSSGVALLDLTDPTAPTAVAEGVYAVTGQVRPSIQGVADTHFSVELDFDYDGDDELSATGTWPLDSDAASGSFAGVYYMPAGGSLVVGVQHDDVSQTIDFHLLAVIQKLA